MRVPVTRLQSHVRFRCGRRTCARGGRRLVPGSAAAAAPLLPADSQRASPIALLWLPPCSPTLPADGFATNATWIEARQLEDPGPFFTSLLARPSTRARVILGPHLYPPSITNSSDVGPTQWEKYATSFGWLQQRGFCDRKGACQRFPVIVGETGSRLQASGDVAYYKAMAAFMSGEPATLDYPHQTVRGWFW
jgi:hypothetical protein